MTTCPYIWVDKDFALVRGLDPGLPEEARPDRDDAVSFGLDCRAEGRTFAGTVSANGHYLARGLVTPERSPRPGRPTTTRRSSNRRHFPRLAAGRHGDPAVHELVRARSRDRSISPIQEGQASLALFPAPGEEHAALAPVRMGTGFRFTFAYTVDDLETCGICARAGPGPRPRGQARWWPVSIVAGIDVSPDHFIGGAAGRPRRSGSCDRSPIDSALLAEVARGGEREAGLAVRAAQEAFPDWAALGAAGRAPYLHRLADLIDRDIDRLADRGVPRHGHARALAARARDRPRRAQLPQLRRPRRRLRGAGLVEQRHR